MRPSRRPVPHPTPARGTPGRGPERADTSLQPAFPGSECAGASAVLGKAPTKRFGSVVSQSPPNSVMCRRKRILPIDPSNRPVGCVLAPARPSMRMLALPHLHEQHPRRTTTHGCPVLIRPPARPPPIPSPARQPFAVLAGHVVPQLPCVPVFRADAATIIRPRSSISRFFRGRPLVSPAPSRGSSARRPTSRRVSNQQTSAREAPDREGSSQPMGAAGACGSEFEPACANKSVGRRQASDNMRPAALAPAPFIGWATRIGRQAPARPAIGRVSELLAQFRRRFQRLA